MENVGAHSVRPRRSYLFPAGYSVTPRAPGRSPYQWVQVCRIERQGTPRAAFPTIGSSSLLQTPGRTECAPTNEGEPEWIRLCFCYYSRCIYLPYAKADFPFVRSERACERHRGGRSLRLIKSKFTFSVNCRVRKQASQSAITERVYERQRGSQRGLPA